MTWRKQMSAENGAGGFERLWKRTGILFGASAWLVSSGLPVFGIIN
jgi:hypothetical protein